MAQLKDLIVTGPSRIIGPNYTEQDITKELRAEKVVVSTANTYGTSLPSSGVTGQVFFKLV